VIRLLDDRGQEVAATDDDGNPLPLPGSQGGLLGADAGEPLSLQADHVDVELRRMFIR
jgi:hypothetical protein